MEESAVLSIKGQRIIPELSHLSKSPALSQGSLASEMECQPQNVICKNGFEVALVGYHLCWRVKGKLSSTHRKCPKLGGLWGGRSVTTAPFPLAQRRPSGDSAPSVGLLEFTNQPHKGTSGSPGSLHLWGGGQWRREKMTMPQCPFSPLRAVTQIFLIPQL